MRPWRPFALCLLLAACGLSARLPAEIPVAPGADAIATTALDAPTAGVPTDTSVDPVAGAIAPAPADDLDVPIAAIAALPGPAALAGTEAENAPTVPAPAPASEAPPPDPKQPTRVPSVAEAACVGRGGAYSSAPDSGVKACVRRTRDSGRQCRKAADCQGECLARSRTCAPIDPLLGCNEILQDNGARVTLCLD